MLHENVFRIYMCVFSLHHKYLIDVIENIQRRFTKRLPGLFNKSYMDRLKMCELELLETRRICTDVALMYKILNGYVCLELNDCVCISHSVPEVTTVNYLSLELD